MRVAAASLLAEPRPEPAGMFFVSVILILACRP